VRAPLSFFTAGIVEYLQLLPLLKNNINPNGYHNTTPQMNLKMMPNVDRGIKSPATGSAWSLARAGGPIPFGDELRPRELGQKT